MPLVLHTGRMLSRVLLLPVGTVLARELLLCRLLPLRPPTRLLLVLTGQ
jgi:hypothetical protein